MRKPKSEDVEPQAQEEAPPSKYSFPKTLGACVDRAYTIREQRLKMERAAAALKSEEAAIKLHVLNTFGKMDVEGARGKVATASVTTRVTGSVKDWDAFYKYIKANDAFDLLHRRLSDAAYRERLGAEESVPGVEPFEVVGLSLTKR